MNLLTLIRANLAFKPLTAIFNILLLALGVATILTLSQLDRQLHERMSRDLQGIDLVVSGKGSPLQIILSTLFLIDIPTGNISVEEADTLAKSPLVKSAIPMALGDNFEGFRIIGTTPAYTNHYGAKLAAGKYPAKAMDVVLGSETARATGAKLGDKIVGAHGLVNSNDLHSELPYTVTGILLPTGSVIDRVVVTPVESVWYVHEHPDADEKEEEAQDHSHHGHELTALLISYKSPIAAAQLPRLINRESSMQAASPAFEVARLARLMGAGSDLVSAFGILLIGFASLGFFVTLNNAINDRLRDIALLRSLGATRLRVVGLILGEALTLGVTGTILGAGLTFILLTIISTTLEKTHHISLSSGSLGTPEIITLLAALALSLVSAIVPACRVYNLRITDILTRT